MVTPDTPCKCPLDDDFKDAGLAARLCHHSSLREINDVKNRLRSLIERFEANLDLAHLFTLPPTQGVEYYIRIATQGDTANMDIEERAIYTTAFMRDYSILVQYAMVQTLEEIRMRGG